MSARLDQEREARLQPERMASTRNALENLGCVVTEDAGGVSMVVHTSKGHRFMLWPYSGWFSGKKPIGSGRGFGLLLRKLKGIA